MCNVKVLNSWRCFGKNRDHKWLHFRLQHILLSQWPALQNLDYPYPLVFLMVFLKDASSHHQAKWWCYVNSSFTTHIVKNCCKPIIIRVCDLQFQDVSITNLYFILLYIHFAPQLLSAGISLWRNWTVLLLRPPPNVVVIVLRASISSAFSSIDLTPNRIVRCQLQPPFSNSQDYEVLLTRFCALAFGWVKVGQTCLPVTKHPREWQLYLFFSTSLSFSFIHTHIQTHTHTHLPADNVQM